MCYKFEDAHYSCKESRGCTTKYDPFIIMCETAQNHPQRHYCEEVRLFNEPVKIPVECDRHNAERLVEFEKVFDREFDILVHKWAKVGTLAEFKKEKERAMNDIFVSVEMFEGYKDAHKKLKEGFYNSLLVAIETNILLSHDQLRNRGLTRVVPAEPVSEQSGTKDSEEAE